MKTSRVFAIVCTIFVVAVIVAVTTITWHKNGGSEWVILLVDKLASMLGGDKKVIREELTSQAWVGTWIEMPGLECPAKDIFGKELRLVFRRNGTCSLEIRDEVVSAKWRIKGDQLLITGGGINTPVYLRQDSSSGAVSYFSLADVENYMVTFYGE